MATKKNADALAPKVQTRKEWIDAYEQGTKTKAQCIARAKAMSAKKAGSLHGRLWTQWLTELEGKPKPKAKAPKGQSLDITSLSKAEMKQLVAFIKKMK